MLYITYLVHHYFITYLNAIHRVIANTTPHPVTLHHIVPGRYSHIYYNANKFVNSKHYITSPYISHQVTPKHNLTYHNRSYQNITSHHTRDHTWLRTYRMSDAPYPIVYQILIKAFDYQEVCQMKNICKWLGAKSPQSVSSSEKYKSR